MSAAPVTLAVSGIGVLSAAGYGAAAVSRCVDDPSLLARADSAGLFDEPLPGPHARLLADFDVRAHLGRKGTSSFDRVTALSVVACQQAIADAGLEIDPASAGRVGAVIGTTVGSFKSTSDFTKETLVSDKPYQVNPSLFPNTIMNGAAAQVAIRFGLHGVNATLAGGPAGFLLGLHYARVMVRRGYVDTMLVGGVEEFSPHRAWLARAAGSPEPAEAAVVVCVTGSVPHHIGAGPDGGTTDPALLVLSTATAFGPTPVIADAALDRCVQRVLAEAAVPVSRVQAVFTTEPSAAHSNEYDCVVAALGHKPQRTLVCASIGDCGAASTGLGLAVARERRNTFEHCLLTARDSDGGVSVALLRSGAAV
jgi:3-oxoacyl-[acyl-carrier-protein] synthase II